MNRRNMRAERRLMLSLWLGLTCLAAGSAFSAEPARKFDGVYHGKRSLTTGKASAMCPAEDSVSVTIQGNFLTFTDSGLKKFTEPFEPHPDGSFGKIHITAGGGATVEYRGHIVGDIMDVDVTNYSTHPPCVYRWQLKKWR